MANFYIVATPIGNLKDISLRALDVLGEVDYVLCEDTRVTKKLLSHYSIQTPTISYHEHSGFGRFKEILDLLEGEKNLALVSDAGTPGVSDPGNKLIAFLSTHLPDLGVHPIPGPSALIAAASIAGFSMDKFLFLGYPPVKKRRKKFFEDLAPSPHSVILYESPHRIIKTLNDLAATVGSERRVVVAKELTKLFEKVYRGSVEDARREIERDGARGEYTVIVANKNV